MGVHHRQTIKREPPYAGHAYVAQAIREIMGDPFNYSGDIGNSIALQSSAAWRRVTSDGTTQCFPDDLVRAGFEGDFRWFDDLRINVSPFHGDVFDFLAILISEDEDHARRRNNRGLSQATSSPGHRIFTQVRRLGKATLDDIETATAIVKKHYLQVAKFIASENAMDAREVLEIFKQRGPALFLNDSVLSRVDNDFDITKVTYIWMERGAIRVHLGAEQPLKGNPYSAFRRNELEVGELAELAASY